ncbi:pirin family protein [Myxococcota bacterium]|nr:pirin family protein [Myxococcota bacterium]MBU1537856.1 pirin family protein [Myxococcota bacterium]
MPTLRTPAKIFPSVPTREGAGVHLHRVFGHQEVPLFDPFLLLDDFSSDIPAHYEKGFPWHPHRGMETITYVIKGEVDHGDSLGNSGTIGEHDVQWMTAGSGIIHQEMPRGDSSGQMHGFQLWANLPSSSKMMAPRYREVKKETIPVLQLPGGVHIRVIAGRVDNTTGPVDDIVTQPQYLDISLPAGAQLTLPTPAGHTCFAYVFKGKVFFGDNADHEEISVPVRSLALFDKGDLVRMHAPEQEARLLLVSGAPIGEPVAWYGPIVMNTQKELDVAFDEYQRGTFIKSSRP